MDIFPPILLLFWDLYSNRLYFQVLREKKTPIHHVTFDRGPLSFFHHAERLSRTTALLENGHARGYVDN